MGWQSSHPMTGILVICPESAVWLEMLIQTSNTLFSVCSIGGIGLESGLSGLDWSLLGSVLYSVHMCTTLFSDLLTPCFLQAFNWKFLTWSEGNCGIFGTCNDQNLIILMYKSYLGDIMIVHQNFPIWVSKSAKMLHFCFGHTSYFQQKASPKGSVIRWPDSLPLK